MQITGFNPAIRAVDAEAVRGIFWTRASISARTVAVMAANFPAERATSSLISFDTRERDIVWSALQSLLCELIVIQKCMCDTPTNNPASKVH
ncbi:hypothetical protein ACQ4WP_21640 [Janthinobacterium sp. GB4P2]|uniref:hypothetical protein n=1 Tax=Janthinobacterium sp. GB4P2 TaxID=3424189 RepID=UPI003F26F8AF